jgi:hypothetical protein
MKWLELAYDTVKWWALVMVVVMNKLAQTNVMEKQKCQTKQTVLALHTPSDVIATAFSI